MRGKIVAARAPILVALAIVLAVVAARSTLATLLPIDITSFPGALWLLLALLAALVPALLARETPLPAAAVVVVPVLAAGAYGASRLDWLRVLKDFGVAEPSALSPVRMVLATLALLLLWGLHAADLALRLRERAIERGIDADEASAAAKRVGLRSAQAAGIALAGAIGLLLVGLLGLALGRVVPTERGALIAPLLAAALLVGAGVWIARSRAAS